MRARVVVVVGLALAAATARAQDQGQSPPGQKGAQAGSRSSQSAAFDQACIDLVNGKMPAGGEKAIRTLRDACASLMAGKADEKIEADRRKQQQAAAQEQLKLQAQGKAPRVQPGTATAQPQAGQDIPAAFGTAGAELAGGKKGLPLGMRSTGRPVGYTLVTDIVGWFTGVGINAILFGSIADSPKFSWMGGVRYSQTDTTDGNTIGFGAVGGLDYFVYGQHNEGLRVGPRLDVTAGRQKFTTTSSSSTFAQLRLGGEVGYNFISSNGISALAAVGVGGRVSGDSKNNNFSSFIPGDFGPYVQLGVGFSW
jgi:hypothetical protein